MAYSRGAPYFQFYYTARVRLAGFAQLPPYLLVGVAVGVSVAVGVAVAVSVCVAVAVSVAVAVGVAVLVDVAVGGAEVKVAVAGCELCRAMRGLIQRAKSSWEEPFAWADRMNLTFSPLSELKSMLIG